MQVISEAEWTKLYGAFAGVAPEKIPDDVYSAGSLNFRAVETPGEWGGPDVWANLPDGRALVFFAHYFDVETCEEIPAWFALSHTPRADCDLAVEDIGGEEAESLIERAGVPVFSNNAGGVQ